MSTHEGNALERWVVDEIESAPGCWIQATPPKLRRTTSGKYAQVEAGPSDFVAVLGWGSLSVVIEAKSTHRKRWELDGLKPHQAAELDRVTGIGMGGAVVVRWCQTPHSVTIAVPWAALAPTWWSHHRSTQQAIRGTASLTPDGSLALGGVDVSRGGLVEALERIAKSARRAA